MLRGSTQRGLTLVEVLLVLALLVIIGALSIPLLSGSISRASLHSAGDLVRGAWSKTRLAAMQSGQTHVFRYEPEGSRFQVVAQSALGLPETNELAADTAVRQDAVDLLRISRNRLPEGVVFAAGESSTARQLLATLPDAAGGPWSTPILFHPDGTTSDVTVQLSNSRGQSIRVTLRGLTGIASTSEDGTSEAPR